MVAVKPPILLKLDSVEDYRNYYIKNFCNEQIITHDKIAVKFHISNFCHAFYEGLPGNRKRFFSRKRAEKMTWIIPTLKSASSILYAGWIKKKQCYSYYRRVANLYHDYVVIINIDRRELFKAHFITAYSADKSIEKIRKSHKWKKPLV